MEAAVAESGASRLMSVRRTSFVLLTLRVLIIPPFPAPQPPIFSIVDLPGLFEALLGSDAKPTRGEKVEVELLFD